MPSVEAFRGRAARSSEESNLTEILSLRETATTLSRELERCFSCENSHSKIATHSFVTVSSRFSSTRATAVQDAS